MGASRQYAALWTKEALLAAVRYVVADSEPMEVWESPMVHDQKATP